MEKELRRVARAMRAHLQSVRIVGKPLPDVDQARVRTYLVPAFVEREDLALAVHQRHHERPLPPDRRHHRRPQAHARRAGLETGARILQPAVEALATGPEQVARRDGAERRPGRSRRFGERRVGLRRRARAQSERERRADHPRR